MLEIWVRFGSRWRTTTISQSLKLLRLSLARARKITNLHMIVLSISLIKFITKLCLVDMFTVKWNITSRTESLELLLNLLNFMKVKVQCQKWRNFYPWTENNCHCRMRNTQTFGWKFINIQREITRFEIHWKMENEIWVYK